MCICVLRSSIVYVLEDVTCYWEVFTSRIHAWGSRAIRAPCVAALLVHLFYVSCHPVFHVSMPHVVQDVIRAADAAGAVAVMARGGNGTLGYFIR